MRRQAFPRLFAPLLLLLLAGVLGACGGDEADVGSGGAQGNEIDRAFVAEMVPHHEAAVEMAEVAQKRGERQEIKQLADAIVETQNAEIESMNSLAAELDEAGIKPGDLGMSDEEMGMSGDSAMLQNAKPFDREFIDMMIPHHQAAIRMARMELDKGKNAEAKKLAEAVIDAQAKEITDMNKWRVDWYGKESPAGGVPAEGDTGGMEDMGH